MARFSNKVTDVVIEFKLNGETRNMTLDSATLDFSQTLNKSGEYEQWEEFESGVKGIAFNKWVFNDKTSKPLKDQSYHQKRIADSLETLVGGEGIDVNIGSKEIQSLKDWPNEGGFHNLSEEDVRTIVNDYIFKNEESHYELHPLMIECIKRIVKEEIDRPVYLHKDKGAVSLKDLALSNYLVIEQK